ncbi:MAG: 3-hydroxyacyl-ACP dehydratase FabZ [Woeseiaceae bacterium]|nr:3-hydroxyacyl-ACP dehydratase FabZ [Woeseiaceae bacterium]NIP19716.1 3-hydroxyacyl-ACP dehydratase FabZ [Woeseiaceae bacterium]NIS89833.1 3-hydroxyacyl-ACP dehydratase FabZ [Woeseiaceae bacterium]
MTAIALPLDVEGIKKLLPHRDPFLMIDEVLEFTAHQSVTAVKNVSADEPHFAGHFPGMPILPGVLIVEAIAQAGGVLSHLSHPALEPKPLYMLARVEDARFRRPVVPGDRLLIRVTADKVKRGMWWYSGEASVDGQLAATATIVCAPGGDNV